MKLFESRIRPVVPAWWMQALGLPTYHCQLHLAVTARVKRDAISALEEAGFYWGAELRMTHAESIPARLLAERGLITMDKPSITAYEPMAHGGVIGRVCGSTVTVAGKWRTIRAGAFRRRMTIDLIGDVQLPDGGE
jgi:hypothetical protein